MSAPDPLAEFNAWRTAFSQVHEGLPRQGPGSDETTALLFREATGAGEDFNRAIDMGAGPGRASLLLAAEGLEVLAVDTHQPFLDHLVRAAHEQGLDSKVDAQNVSMDAVEVSAPVDLIWAEGTAYIIGLDTALRNWRPLLRSGGKLVFTDCFWTTAQPSLDCAKFWEADPNMIDVVGARELAEKAGFAVDFVYQQPDDEWFTEYYDPLEREVEKLADSTDPVMQKVLEDTRTEIDIRRRFPTEYAHVGFVLTTTM